MDKTWKFIYDRNARRNIPKHQMSCWSKQGFEERFEFLKGVLPQIITQNKIRTALDVGCGPGTYCGLLKEQGLEVTGVDYSEEVLKHAKKDFPDLTFQTGNVYDLRFKDRSFDLVLCIGLLQCVNDYEKAMEELLRVAKKTLIISTLRAERWPFDPQSDLRQQLKTDSWPTRKFHPNNLIPIIENKKFSVMLVENDTKGKRFEDCFFLICRRN